MTSPATILGIETAVAGGSLSLYQGESQLASLCGGETPLRAGDVLIRIDELLNDAQIKKGDLTLVTVSAGPGSFTGIRVGISTALGLCHALGIRLASYSVLEAVAFVHTLTGVAAVPMGRGSACAQRFANGSPLDTPFNITIEDLMELDEPGEFLAHPELPQREIDKGKTVYFGLNLASALARMTIGRPVTFASPIFLSR